MICPKCNFALPEDSVFCTQCGTKLVPTEIPVYPGAGGNVQPPFNGTPSPETYVQQPVYNAPAPGAFNQPPVYNAPAPGAFNQPPVYNAPAPEAFAQQPVYNAPAPEAFAQQPDYEAPAVEADIQQPVYEAPAVEADIQQPDYEAPAVEADIRQPVYDAPAVEADIRQPVYDAPAPEAFAQQPVYDAPVPEAFAQQPVFTMPVGGEYPVQPEDNIPTQVAYPQQPENAPEGEADVPAPAPVQKKKKTGLIIGIVCGVAVLAVITAVIWFFVFKDKDNQPDEGETSVADEYIEGEDNTSAEPEDDTSDAEDETAEPDEETTEKQSAEGEDETAEPIIGNLNGSYDMQVDVGQIVVSVLQVKLKLNLGLEYSYLITCNLDITDDEIRISTTDDALDVFYEDICNEIKNLGEEVLGENASAIFDMLTPDMIKLYLSDYVDLFSLKCSYLDYGDRLTLEIGSRSVTVNYEKSGRNILIVFEDENYAGLSDYISITRKGR